MHSSAKQIQASYTWQVSFLLNDEEQARAYKVEAVEIQTATVLGIRKIKQNFGSGNYYLLTAVTLINDEKGEVQPPYSEDELA